MRIQAAVLTESGRPRPYATHRPLHLVEVDLAPPGPTEILVRIRAAGVCHSDLSVVDGNRRRPLPILLGHEASGTVVTAGPEVTDVHAGDLVVLSFLPRCELCASCRTGGRLPCEPGSRSNTEGTLLSGGSRLRWRDNVLHHHLGVSAFATHAVVDARSATVVAPDIPPDVAAVLGCAVLTGGGAVLNAGEARPGQGIAVVGLGGVGMAAVLVAASQKYGVVAGIDLVPEKRKLAMQIGANAAFAPEEALERGMRFDLVIEAAGHPRAFETAFALTAPGGRTVTVGLPPPDARSSISPLVLTSEARSIVGSYLGSAIPQRDIPKYVDMWRQGELPVERLITGRGGLEGINQSMDALADGLTLRHILIPN